MPWHSSNEIEVAVTCTRFDSFHESSSSSKCKGIHERISGEREFSVHESIRDEHEIPFLDFNSESLSERHGGSNPVFVCMYCVDGMCRSG